MANSVLYGLMQQKDLAANLTPQNIVINLDRELMISVTLETIQQHNAEINSLRSLFSNDTTDYTLFYRGQLNNDLQEGDENAKPLPVKGVAHYSVGFPIRIATTGWGANYTTLEQMTVQDFSDRTDQMLIGDVNWHRKWTLGTLLFSGTLGSDSPYVFTDPKFGSINVYGLANGDTVKYDRVSGLAPTTDNHYTAQNGAISDTTGQNPFPTIETALLEHPQNGTTLVSYISPTLTASVKGLVRARSAEHPLHPRRQHRDVQRRRGCTDPAQCPRARRLRPDHPRRMAHGSGQHHHHASDRRSQTAVVPPISTGDSSRLWPRRVQPRRVRGAVPLFF